VTKVKSRVAHLVWVVGSGLACAGLPAEGAAQTSPFVVEVEGGPAWQTRNDAEVPNDGTATRFSISDLVGAGPRAATRIYLTWRRSESQAMRLLVAPLSLTEAGTPSGPLTFAGETYEGGEPLRAKYTFNSYRLSYLWRVHAGARSELWIGATAKVRDATIALAQGDTRSRTDDLGFVPLFHLSADRRFDGGWSLAFDADALAGGPGRAIDASLKVGYDLDDRWSVRAGYRTVEGGADVESVYSFAWLHYLAASIVWRIG
jgi:hypothetical protein